MGGTFGGRAEQCLRVTPWHTLVQPQDVRPPNVSRISFVNDPSGSLSLCSRIIQKTASRIEHEFLHLGFATASFIITINYTQECSCAILSHRWDYDSIATTNHTQTSSKLIKGSSMRDLSSHNMLCICLHLFFTVLLISSFFF